MISRLLICFSVCLLAGKSAEAAAASAVAGRITFSAAPEDKHQIPEPSGTVVWLKPLSPAPGSDPPTPRRFKMLQKNKTFLPHVLAITVGSTVDFPNADPVFHNAFSNYDGQVFDIGLYPPGTSRGVIFDRAGVVRIFCNIHAAMSAVIVVLDTPFFTTSGADGGFRLTNVPPGRYRLYIYNERATEKSLRDRERLVEVSATPQDIGAVTIESSTSLNIPHLNKYGKSYPPATPSTVYPGARQ